jgi:guanylate kinase
VGKSSLCGRLLNEFDGLKLSVSVTTRAPRGAEKDGQDYHFVDMARFEAMVAEGRFAEHALVHSNRYGTLKSSVEEILSAGDDMLFDIDYQGSNQLRETFPQANSVLLVPPSMVALERRLRARKTDEEGVIVERLAAARMEMAQFGSFDYVVVNEDIEQAYTKLKSVYIALSQRTSRQRPFVESLLKA